MMAHHVRHRPYAAGPDVAGSVHPARRGYGVVGAIALLATFALSAPAFAQLPDTKLYALSPPGGGQGAQFDLTITSGEDLDDVNRLLFSHPGVTATPVMTEATEFLPTPRPVANRFRVSIAADTPPGVYEARAVGKYGASNTRAFVVSDRAEVLEAEPNNSLAEAQSVEPGAVINGTADGEAVDYYRFSAAAGQHLVIDCWADRIDSRMDATLAVFDSAGRELAHSRDAHRRDPLIDFRAPADGEYIVKVHDFIYQGGAEYFYRLALSTQPRIAFVFPPAGMAGASQEFTLYGRNLPGGAPADDARVTKDTPLEQLKITLELPSGDAAFERQLSGGRVAPSETVLDGFDYRLDSPAGASNPVFIGFATAPVVLETEPNDESAQAQAVSLPCEFAGQFFPARDEDWITFDAKKGEVHWIEVISERLGLRTDASILVQRVVKKEDGSEQIIDVQDADDSNENIGDFQFETKTSDPSYRFSAPEDGVYRLLVKNLAGGSRDDPRRVYRLSIRPERPDFRLAALPEYPTQDQTKAAPWNPLLRKGGAAAIRVMAFRRDNFGGDIELTVENLPSGVSYAPVTLGAGQNTAWLVLRAADDAEAWVGEIKIVGAAMLGDEKIVRRARPADVLWPGDNNRQTASVEARMERNLVVAVADDETAAFSVTPTEEKTWHTSRAGKLQIPVVALRRGEFKEALALKSTGFPGKVKANDVSLAADKAEGVIEVEVPRDAAVGAFSFRVDAETKINYRRNPEAAEQAEQESKAIEQLATRIAEEAQQADARKQAAEKNAADSTAEAQRAAEANQVAAQAATEAAGQAAAAAARVAEAQAALAALEQTAAEAVAKSQKSEQARVESERLAKEAQAKAEAAVAEKAAAEKAATEAAARVTAANEAKEAAAKRAKETSEAAKPKDLNVRLPAAALTVLVREAPLTVSAQPGEAPLKPSSKIEIPVQIERLFGFADAVEIEPILPGGVQGLTIARVSIPADQSQGLLVVEANEKPTAGSHRVTLRVNMKFNNQDLRIEPSVPIAVEAASE